MTSSIAAAPKLKCWECETTTREATPDEASIQKIVEGILLICSGCDTARYCGRTCQKKKRKSIS